MRIISHLTLAALVATTLFACDQSQHALGGGDQPDAGSEPTIDAMPTIEPKCTVTLEVTDGIAMEGGTDKASFMCKRTGCPLDNPLTIEYDIAGVAANTFQLDTNNGGWFCYFAPSETQDTVEVTAANNAVDESDKIMIVTLRAANHFTVGSPNAGQITLKDNDVGTLPAPTIGTFTANPNSCTGACNSTLGWTGITNATTCSIGGNNVPTGNSSLIVAVNATTTYTLTCSGPGGNVSANATVTINPPTGNNPPTGSLTAPTPNQGYNPPPATVHMAATASDNDGMVVRVDFRAGNMLVNSDPTAPYEFDWLNVAAGTYVITATAVDDDGASTLLGTANIVVGSGAPTTFDIVCPPNSGMTKIWFWSFTGGIQLTEINVPSGGGTWNSRINNVNAGSGTGDYNGRWDSVLNNTFPAGAPTACYGRLADGTQKPFCKLAQGQGAWGVAWNGLSCVQ